MLTLPIKRMWFDMIASGEKKEEYREAEQYVTECICRGQENLDVERTMDQLHDKVVSSMGIPYSEIRKSRG